MEVLLYTFFLGLSSAHMTFLLFKTNFILDYAKLLGQGKLFGADSYEAWKKQNCGDAYVFFLAAKYPDNFFAKLVSCPICLTTFLCIFGTLLFAHEMILTSIAASSVAWLVYKQETKE